MDSSEDDVRLYRRRQLDQQSQSMNHVQQQKLRLSTPMKRPPRLAQNWQIFSQDPIKGLVTRQFISCRSLAWIIFRRDQDKIDGQCRICGRTKRTKGGGTTHLLNHIQQKHLDLRVAIQQKMRVKRSFPQNVINLCQNYQLDLVDNKIELRPINEHQDNKKRTQYFIACQKNTSKRRKTQAQSMNAQNSENIIEQNIEQNNFERLDFQGQRLSSNQKAGSLYNHQPVQSQAIQTKYQQQQPDQNLQIQQQNEQHCQSIQYHQKRDVQRNYNHISIPYQLSSNQMNQQTYLDKTTLDNLRNNSTINIVQCYEKGVLVSFTIITKLMQLNFIQFPDFISFWYYPKPTVMKHIQSIVYIIGQGNDIMPLLLGISIIFKQNEANFIEIFRMFQKQYKYCEKKYPRMTIVCGSTDFSSYFRVFIEKLNQGSQQKHQYITLKGDILTSQNQNYRNMIITRKLRLQLLHNFSKDPVFIGFSLSTTFIDRLSLLTPLNFGTQAHLTALLNRIFMISENLSQYQFNAPRFHKIRLFNSIQLSQIITQKQIVQCESLLAYEIYQRLCYSYIYAQYSLYVRKNENFYEIYEICQNSRLQSHKKMIKVRKNQQNQWQCECRITSWSLLPCPHQIKVYLIEKIKIKKAINTRWIINKKQQRQINIKQKYSNSKQNQNQDINKNSKQQLYQSCLGILSENKYLQVFWA